LHHPFDSCQNCQPCVLVALSVTTEDECMMQRVSSEWRHCRPVSWIRDTSIYAIHYIHHSGVFIHQAGVLMLASLTAWFCFFLTWACLTGWMTLYSAYDRRRGSFINTTVHMTHQRHIRTSAKLIQLLFTLPKYKFTVLFCILQLLESIFIIHHFSWCLRETNDWWFLFELIFCIETERFLVATCLCYWAMPRPIMFREKPVHLFSLMLS
jgi:hypothetical protein